MENIYCVRGIANQSMKTSEVLDVLYIAIVKPVVEAFATLKCADE